MRAVEILAAATGGQVAASRAGGRQQQLAVIQSALQVPYTEATRIIRGLENQAILIWSSDHGPNQECPYILDRS